MLKNKVPGTLVFLSKPHRFHSLGHENLNLVGKDEKNSGLNKSMKVEISLFSTGSGCTQMGGGGV